MTSMSCTVAVHPLGPDFCLSWEYHALAIRHGGLSPWSFGHYAYFILYILGIYCYMYSMILVYVVCFCVHALCFYVDYMYVCFKIPGDIELDHMYGIALTQIL